MQEKLSLIPLAANKSQFQFQVCGVEPKVVISFRILLTETWLPLVSHVSVLDVLPVHQHVIPAQHPYMTLTRHHVALKVILAVSVDLRRRNGVDAVLGEEGHWLSEKRKKDRWVQVCSNNRCSGELILDKSRGTRRGCFFCSLSHHRIMVAMFSYDETIENCTKDKKHV